MNLIDRRALFASGAAAALLSSVGVGVGATPRSGGRLRAGLSGAVRGQGFEALHSGEAGLFLQTIAMSVFDTLTEVGPDGALRGELATGWSSSDDARVWTLELRNDVVFHDGTSLTSDAVVDALRPTMDILNAVCVKRISSHAVKITLNDPDPNLPYLLSNPSHVIFGGESIEQAIGTGLYAMHRNDLGRHFIGKRMASHYKDGQAGWFDEVEFVALPAEVTRLRALSEGFVDVIDHLHDARMTRHIAQPKNIGTAQPLDNLRMAERWWIA